MKKLFLSMLMMGILMANAQDIKLPAPDMTQKSMSVVDALATRHSVREYSNQELTNQEISNLCWAACGVSRDDAHRTAPTAMNRKEIRLYVFTSANVYEYIATENLLKQVATGDQRKLIAAGQAFAQTAPVSLLMVIDFDLFGGNNERSVMMGCVDAGNVSENINLYCQAVGMATVPRATHDTNGLKQLLNLSDNQMPIMNNPVGFPK
ncbi:MAG: nitroreductase family protein [Bacteroidales bacterium]|nr:nitroreductase family protein [Candidatus Minthousia equi]